MSEFIILPTRKLFEVMRSDLLKMEGGFPSTDVLVNLAIDAINSQYESKLPINRSLDMVLLGMEFEGDQDGVVLSDTLVHFTIGLRDLCAIHHVYTPKGIPYRFWSTVNDDCILQHTTSPTRPPSDTYRVAGPFFNTTQALSRYAGV